MRLADKVAIVTGGATGIGRGISEAFPREGAKIVIACRTRKRGEAVVDDLTKAGAEAVYVQTDISQLDQIDHLVRETVNLFGRVDILVNNAGVITEFGPFLECTEERFDKVISVNLKGSFFLTQRVAREMIQTGGGKIIFISSNIAQRAQPDSAHYVASKGGINALVINLAAVLGPHNICVNAISPGEIRVEAAAGWFDDPANQELFQAIPAAEPPLRELSPVRLAGPFDALG